MSHRESLVREVLFEACRVDDRPAASWRPETDWPEVVERATAAKVAAHVHHLVERRPDGVPAEIRQRLAALYRRQAADAVINHEALREILGALAAARIPVIVLKGAAMATAVYQNVAERPMRDLDLLFRSPDLDGAEAVLRSLGYAGDEWYRPRDWYLTNLHHRVPMARGPVTVELHHDLTPPAAPVRLQLDDLWRRARTATIAGAPALVLAPVDLVLHVCLHLTTADPFARGLGVVRDIAEVLQRHGAELDGEILIRSARAAGATRHLYAALETARTVTGVAVPARLLGAARQAAGFTWMGDAAIHGIGRVTLAAGSRRRFATSTLVTAWGHALVDAGSVLPRAWMFVQTVSRLLAAARARPPVATPARSPAERDDGSRSARDVPAVVAAPGSGASLTRSEGVREYPMGDELLIYPPGGDAAHALNPSARIVWALCDGTRSADDICRELAVDLGRTPEELAGDVRVAIQRFRELGLLAAE